MLFTYGSCSNLEFVRPGLGMGTRWAEGIPKAWTHNKRMLAPRALTRSASRFGGDVLALAFIYK